jgi:hypothetical protein
MESGSRIKAGIRTMTKTYPIPRRIPRTVGFGVDTATEELVPSKPK